MLGLVYMEELSRSDTSLEGVNCDRYLESLSAGLALHLNTPSGSATRI